MKKLFLRGLAGGLWFYGIDLMLLPIIDFRGIPATLGCIIGGVALFGLGCTAAMLAADGKTGNPDPARGGAETKKEVTP